MAIYHKPTEINRAMVRSEAAQGSTRRQIASFLGIQVHLIKKHYDLEYRTGRVEFEKTKPALVKHSLFQTAMGYYITETKQIIKSGVVVLEEISQKYIKPNVTAQMYILNNIEPESWKPLNREKTLINTDERHQIIFTKQPQLLQEHNN